MTETIFFSDLDQTLIYSARQLKRYNQTSVGNLIVEEYNEAPLSMISFEAYTHLLENTGKTFDLIPTTTRTLEQYSRISFPHVPINNFVVLNGGKVFEQGEEVLEWTHHIRDEIAKLSVTPKALYQQILSETQNFEGLKVVQCADEAFVYFVSDVPGIKAIDRYTDSLAKETGYVLSRQGRKTYLVPECVSKGKAVEYLINDLKPTVTVAAGDSELDISMGDYVDLLLIPKHGEGVSEARNARYTEEVGINAAKEILDVVGVYSRSLQYEID